MPINTAPTDGTEIIAWSEDMPSMPPRRVRWDGKGWFGEFAGYRFYLHPTHWSAADVPRASKN